MKVLPKILSAFMTLIVVLSLFSCGKTAPPALKNAEDIVFPLKDQIRVSMFAPFDYTYMTEYETLADHPVFKRLQEKTNMVIEFVHPGDAQWVTELQLYVTMNAAGDLPGILRGGYDNGGVDRLIDEGVYLRLNDKIPVFMKNFDQLMRDNAVIGKNITSARGNITYIPSVTGLNADVLPPVSSGLLVRKDALDELQLGIPETVDEWETVLKKLKVSGEFEKPLYFGECFMGAYMPGEIFASAYGGGQNFALDDDQKVVPYFINDGTREYFTKMNSWYEQGILWTGKLAEKELSQDVIGAFAGSVQDIDYLKTLAGNPRYELAAAPYPVLKKGDVLETGIKASCVSNFFSNSFVITTNNQYPNESLKMIDIFFTKEMYMECSYGILNEDYTMVDGKPVFTDKILKYDQSKTGVQGGLASYTWLSAPYKDPMAQYQICTDAQKKAVHEVWAKFDLSRRMLPPNLYYASPGDSEAVGEGRVYETGWKYTAEFVTGETPMTAWDDYVDEVYACGLIDVVAMLQEMYNRFLVA